MSIQAAQRRRAGPTSETMAPGRGPQPSINSAQMFANQARPGQGPSMPTGRLAGQQVEQQQKQQQQQQQKQQKQQSTTDGLSSVSKMTIAQAITLITLRLGNIESKMINLANLQEIQPQSQSVAIDGQEMVLIDTSVLQSITSRLESLEKRSGSASVSSGPEMNLLKQQFETVKQTLIQTKSATVQSVKDNKDLKTQVENLKQDLLYNRHLLNEIQKLAMSNSNKILEISMNMSGENEAVYNCQTLDNMLDSTELSQFNDFNEDSSQNELVGTNLKELIENELNSGINIIDDEHVALSQTI